MLLGWGNKWRRFCRKYGMTLFLVCLVGVILALVAFLMFMLTSPDWRPR